MRLNQRAKLHENDMKYTLKILYRSVVVLSIICKGYRCFTSNIMSCLMYSQSKMHGNLHHVRAIMYIRSNSRLNRIKVRKERNKVHLKGSMV